jgi:hypothetical protein
MIDTGSSSGSVETVETVTSQGIAKTSYRIPSKGLLGITVQADPALISQALRLDITDSGGVLTAIEPTILPTNTQALTTQEPTPAVTTKLSRDLHADGLPTPGDWLLSTILILGLSACLFWLGSTRASLQWGIRWATLSCLGGYLSYLYLVIGLPGSSYLISISGSTVVALISVLGVIVGWGVAGIWWSIDQHKTAKKTSM